MRILGISGKKGSGKTTVACGIADECPRNTRITSLAAPLKEICVLLFGLDPDALRGDDAAKDRPTRYTWQSFPTPPPPGVRLDSPITHREFMQYFATQVVRRIDPDAWVNCLTRRVASSPPDCLWVVDDVRFHNEVEGIQKAGGKVIRLTRAVHGDDQHVSETALDGYRGFDAVLDNDRLTIEESITQARQLVQGWQL